MAEKSRIWGYILDAPGRPTLAKQRLALEALGVDMGEFGTCWADRAAKLSTRPRNQLTARADLLGAVMPGDTVAIAAPWCLGASPKDAAWFLAQLGERGVAAVVNGDMARIEPGGDASALIEEVARRQNVFHSSASQKRARKIQTGGE